MIFFWLVTIASQIVATRQEAHLRQALLDPSRPCHVRPPRGTCWVPGKPNIGGHQGRILNWWPSWALESWSLPWWMRWGEGSEVASDDGTLSVMDFKRLYIYMYIYIYRYRHSRNLEWCLKMNLKKRWAMLGPTLDEDCWAGQPRCQPGTHIHCVTSVELSLDWFRWVFWVFLLIWSRNLSVENCRNPEFQWFWH